MKAKAVIVFALSLAVAPLAHAQLQISIGVRETDAVGGPEGPIGSDGGTSGGIEWINLDQQTLILDGTWQQFTFTFSTATINAFAGATANAILEGNYGVLEHIRIRNSGGLTHNINIWIDDINNSVSAAGAPPQSVTFGSFEGFANASQVIFNEPGFSGSTASNLMPGSIAGVDNSFSHSGSASYAASFQFVDSLDTRWVRWSTFNADNIPNPLIRFDQNSVLTFWMMGVPEPGTMCVLAAGALAGVGRRRRK